VLGAAAFLIAEFLKISYLDVIWMAAIPTILYYFSILVMVELDAAKYGGGGELLVQKGTLWRITRGYWFHFGSLVSIIAFMLYGFSPVLSVFWATMLGDCGELSAPRYRAGAAQARARAGRRHHRRAEHRRHLRHRRHHRRVTTLTGLAQRFCRHHSSATPRAISC